MNNFVWRWEEINEWLPIQDAVISHYLSPLGGRVLEVGTWKGGWALSMAENNRSRDILCVDPYPNLESVKAAFLKVAEQRVPNQIELHFSLENALSGIGVSLDVAHIDGEHSQDAVYQDLLRTIPHLKSDGLLIIDDIFYHSFPGVTAAAFKVIEEFEFSPFLFTEKKLYMCRKQMYSNYYEKAKILLDSLRLEYEEDQLLSDKNHSYIQRNSINGYSLLILDCDKMLKKDFYKSIGVKRKFDFKQLARQVLPPILLRCLQTLRAR